MSTPEPAATAPAPKKPAKLTGYTILKLTKGAEEATAKGEFWTIEATVAARSASEAVKQAAGASAGRYVAVPERSWAPVTVTVEQTTRIKLT